MSRLIDADALMKRCSCKKNCNECDFFTDGDTWCDGEVFGTTIMQMPTVDAVPTDFHDKCMQAEIKKRIRLEKIAKLLCEGYLDMPSGCDGCPLVDTMVEDEEGNGVCDLYRR